LPLDELFASISSAILKTLEYLVGFTIFTETE